MNRNDYKQLNTAYKNNTTNNIVEQFKRGKDNITPFGCPASKYCPNSSQKKKAYDVSCPNGFYCPESSDKLPVEILPISCPIGFYCPKNKKRPFICPPNFPNSNRMSTKCEDCFNVEKGVNVYYQDKKKNCFR